METGVGSKNLTQIEDNEWEKLGEMTRAHVVAVASTRSVAFRKVF